MKNLTKKMKSLNKDKEKDIQKPPRDKMIKGGQAIKK